MTTPTSTTPSRISTRYRLLNKLDMSPGRKLDADLLITEQVGSRDDLRALWSAHLIGAEWYHGALDLVQHIDAGGRLRSVTVKLAARGVEALQHPTNRVLCRLHPRRVLSADQVMGDTGIDRSLLADMVERSLIKANYPPTGNQAIPGEMLREFAIPTAHVMLRLAPLGRRYLPLGEG